MAGHAAQLFTSNMAQLWRGSVRSNLLGYLGLRLPWKVLAFALPTTGPHGCSEPTRSSPACMACVGCQTVSALELAVPRARSLPGLLGLVGLLDLLELLLSLLGLLCLLIGLPVFTACSNHSRFGTGPHGSSLRAPVRAMLATTPMRVEFTSANGGPPYVAYAAYADNEGKRRFDSVCCEWLAAWRKAYPAVDCYEHGLGLCVNLGPGHS